MFYLTGVNNPGYNEDENRNENSDFDCPKCGERFTNAEDLMSHIDNDEC